MKLILFHQYFLGKDDPGGSRWNQFTKHFARKNQIFVISGNIHYITGKRIAKKRFYNKEQISENIHLIRSWTYAGYNANFFGRLIGYLSYTISSFLAGLLISKPDMIIVTSPPLFVGLSALLLSWVKRIPFVFEVRDLWPESAIATNVLTNRQLISIMYWLEKLLYKHAEKIIPLTPAFKKDIIRRFPAYKNKIQVITNGADFDLMKQGSGQNWVCEKFGWQNKKVFSYFGAHGVANDLIQVVEVARLFASESTVHFALIGDGMQKEMLRKKIQEYNLKNIQLIDSVPKHQVADFINASTVCMAILKKTDTFKTVYPNKVFDYMACSKPVLVTIDGITRELIETAGCGYYAEPDNKEDFRKIVEKFSNMDDPTLQQLGKNGYQYVRKNFDRENLADKYMQCLGIG